MDMTWVSFVPDYLAQDILENPQASPIGREQRFDAVALFADVSGFTSMSEALGRTGKSGIEELTAILNSYFAPMIELIRTYGGIVGKFGGDAMTVLFPYTQQTQAQTVRRAIECALHMQTRMDTYKAVSTSAGVFGLTMKAGLALGPVFCTTVGDLAVRLEYIIAGEVLDLCAEAEHHATPGEVVIHNQLLPYVGSIEISETRDDFSCVTGTGADALLPLPPQRDVPPQAVDVLAGYLHPTIAQRLKAGLGGFINEHREVTTLFVNFTGFDYDHDVEVGTRLQTYFADVIRMIQRYDGYLNKIDMGDKGSKYVVLFGAPVAHEDDEERALHCALELNWVPGAQVSIGINTGFVFCGQVGSTARQEYTVMGDAVILAARLMQAAQAGEILVSASTEEQSKGIFQWQHREPIQVKGKTEYVPIYGLQGVKEKTAIYISEPAYGLPLIGREPELQVARDRIDAAIRRQGQIVGISGEAGMGKSRLNAEIIKLAVGKGLVGYGGACQSYNTYLSYAAWTSIWRGFFELEPSMPSGSMVTHLETQLAAIDPGLVQRIPLLGSILNMPIPDNALTESLDAPSRVELLNSLLLSCLQARTSRNPVLFVLEDCHWMDAASYELLEFLGRNLAGLPVLLIFLYRPDDTAEGFSAPLKQFPHFTEINLTEFNTANAEELIQLKMRQLFGAQQSVPAGFVQRIMTRTQGNPFYIEELMNYVHDRQTPLDKPENIELPASLNSLIISRIDLLSESEKTALKVASVIGRLFKARWVWESQPSIGMPDTIRRHLSRLSHLEVTALNTPEPELEYLFKHVITREVIYDSLAFNTRAVLHEQIGQYIERVYTGDLSQYLDLLAYHFGRTRNLDKQKLYFRSAGDRSRAAYANDAAIDYYQRLLPLLAEAERMEVMRLLGDVWQLTGKWEDAERIYRQAFADAEASGDRLAQAHCRNGIGHLLDLTGNYPEALTWLGQALQDFESLNNRQGVSQALEYLSLVHLPLGNYDEALTLCERQLQLATADGNRRAISVVHMRKSWVYLDQGNLPLAQENLEQALAIAGEINYQMGIINAHSDLAGLYFVQGNYAQALSNCLDALTIATSIGYRQRGGHIILNMGEIYRQQGVYTSALDCYSYGLSIFLELGDTPAMFNAIGNIASVYLAQSRYEEAETLNTLTIRLGRKLNIPYVLCEYLYNQALLLTLLRRYEAALATSSEAREVATQVGHQEFQFKALILSLRLRVFQQQTTSADASQELLLLLEQWVESDQQAAIHYELWRLDPNREESRNRAADFYQELYRVTPNVEYRQRYSELTGQILPDPPSPPLAPELAAQSSAHLSDLIQRAEAIT